MKLLLNNFLSMEVFLFQKNPCSFQQVIPHIFGKLLFLTKKNSESIKDLFGTLQANKTYCFSTHPGPFGWCATCDLNAKEWEKGHCSKKHPKNPEELTVPTPSKVKYKNTERNKHLYNWQVRVQVLVQALNPKEWKGIWGPPTHPITPRFEWECMVQIEAPSTPECKQRKNTG